MRWVPKGLTVSLLKLFTFLTPHNKIFILFFCDFLLLTFETSYFIIFQSCYQYRAVIRL